MRFKEYFSENGCELAAYFGNPPQREKGLKRMWGEKRRKSQEWLDEYKRISNSRMFAHDERWLTLMALYSLLGDQSDLGLADRVKGINRRKISPTSP